MPQIQTKLCRTIFIAGLALAAPVVTLAVSFHSAHAAAEANTAATGTYTVDPAHTSITFKVNHLGFSNFTARFDKVDGRLDYDNANVENSKVDIVIDPASIDTNVTKLDEELKADNALNVKKFPIMIFKSTKVTRTGATTGTIAGEFTMLGVTKPVNLNVTLIGAGQHPMKKTSVIGFSATGKLNRSDFGLKNWLPMVGDEVVFVIETEFAQN